MIRVTALDDHPLILEAYQTIFKHQDEMTFVAGFATGEKLLDFLQKESCDILILDMHLGYGKSGLDWCKIIRKEYPDIKILGISTYDEFGIIKTFIRNGGLGFILKSADPPVFVKAIHAIYKGEEYFQEELKDALLQQTLKNKSSNEYIPTLTKREKEVLQLIVDGETTQEIAGTLHLSTHTIESHRKNLMTKLNVSNVASLVREALQKGLLNQ